MRRNEIFSEPERATVALLVCAVLATMMLAFGCRGNDEAGESVGVPPLLTSKRAETEPTASANTGDDPRVPTPEEERLPEKSLIWMGSPNAPTTRTSRPLRTGDAPILMDVDADGREEVIGLVVKPSSHTTHPVVVDTESVLPRWLGPRLEVIGGGDGGAMLVEAAGGVVVATTARSEIIALDAATGSEISRFPSPARVLRLCVVGSAIRAFSGDDNVELDTKSRSFRKTAAACDVGAPAERLPERGPLADYALEDWVESPQGPVVRAQRRSDGRPEVIAFGVDGRAIRWQRVLGGGNVVAGVNWRHDVLLADGDTVFAEYEVGKVTDPFARPERTQERHIVAIDAATGVVRWDAVSPKKGAPSNSSLATSSRLYVTRFTQLEVYDRASGRLFGYVGWR